MPTFVVNTPTLEKISHDKSPLTWVGQVGHDTDTHTTKKK